MRPSRSRGPEGTGGGIGPYSRKLMANQALRLGAPLVRVARRLLTFSDRSHFDIGTAAS